MLHLVPAFHLLLQVVPQAAHQVLTQTPWDWASSHIHLIGWPTLLLIVWRAGKAFNDVSTHFTKAVGQIDQMATNHFPHMEASLAKQDVYLESIDKNIGRLADRL